MTPELQAAVENAYTALAGYRVGLELDFAARVDTSDDAHRRLRVVLTTTPLRSLSFEAIEAYFDYVDAAHYDGAFRADEVRYFLPRALEPLARNGVVSTPSWLQECVERCLDRSVARAAWPPIEIAAVDGVLDALLPKTATD